MNFVTTWYKAGSPVITAPPAVPVPVPQRNEPFYILQAFDQLNAQYNAAQAWVNALTARVTAVQNAVSGGNLNNYAALLYQQQPNDAAQFDIILGLAAAVGIATAGPALITAATAIWLTPVQTALQTFTTTYQATLHAAGRV
jgi:hypothetical protein